MAFRTSTRFVLDKRREVIGFLLAAVLAARLLLGDANTVIVFCWVHVLSFKGFMYTCKGSFIYFSDLCSNFDSYMCIYKYKLSTFRYIHRGFFLCICIYLQPLWPLFWLRGRSFTPYGSGKCKTRPFAKNTDFSNFLDFPIFCIPKENE